jgi:hypothetical protein
VAWGKAILDKPPSSASLANMQGVVCVLRNKVKFEGFQRNTMRASEGLEIEPISDEIIGLCNA